VFSLSSAEFFLFDGDGLVFWPALQIKRAQNFRPNMKKKPLRLKIFHKLIASCIMMKEVR